MLLKDVEKRVVKIIPAKIKNVSPGSDNLLWGEKNDDEWHFIFFLKINWNWTSSVLLSSNAVKGAYSPHSWEDKL